MILGFDFPDSDGTKRLWAISKTPVDYGVGYNTKVVNAKRFPGPGLWFEPFERSKLFLRSETIGR
jgi:hypothetical protein